MPDFSLEHQFQSPVAGVDEVGRGPWAGPVVACAAILDRDRIPSLLLEELDDSKKLTMARREALFDRVAAVASIGIGAASVSEIDRLNILQATFLAMRRAVRRLPVVPAHVLVDGNKDPGFVMPTTAVVKGDQKSFSVAAASIIAKVVRDRGMAKLACRYPAFGWERNAGYGVKKHQAALAQFGPTPHHRRSFAPVAKAALQFNR